MSSLPKENKTLYNGILSLVVLFVVGILLQTTVSYFVAPLFLDVDTDILNELTEKSEAIAKSSNISPDNLQQTLVEGSLQIKAMLNRSEFLWIYFLQISYNIVCFLVVALVFRRYMFSKNEIKKDWKKSPLQLYLLTPMLLLSSTFLLSKSLQLNEALGIDWVLNLLDWDINTASVSNMIFGYAVFLPESYEQLLTSLLFVAIVPALGEELFFRAGIQKFLSSKVKNTHNVIFITAFIFSAIHMDITAFFYRFLLGVLLGYVYYWSKSIVIPIIIHALNNSLSLVAMFYISRSGSVDSEVQLDQIEGEGTMMALSVIMLCSILYTFYSYHRKVTTITKISA